MRGVAPLSSRFWADGRLLFAAIDGAAQHCVRDPATYPLSSAADRLVDRFRVRA